MTTAHVLQESSTPSLEDAWTLCTDCGVPQLFVAPPCADGHGHDCPDLACAVCGLAMTRTALLLTQDVLLAD